MSDHIQTDCEESFQSIMERTIPKAECDLDICQYQGNRNRPVKEYTFKGEKCINKDEYEMIYACSCLNPIEGSKITNMFTPSDASGRFIFACLNGGNTQEAQNLLINLNGANPCVMSNSTSLLQYCYELSHLDVFSLVVKYPQWTSEDMCQDLGERALMEGRFDYVDVLIEHKLFGYTHELMRKLIEKQDTQALLYLAEKCPDLSILSHVNNVEEFKYLHSVGCPFEYDQEGDFSRMTLHWTSSDKIDFSLEDVVFIYSHANDNEKDKVRKFARKEASYFNSLDMDHDNSDFSSEAAFFKDLMKQLE